MQVLNGESLPTKRDLHDEHFVFLLRENVMYPATIYNALLSKMLLIFTRSEGSQSMGSISNLFSSTSAITSFISKIVIQWNFTRHFTLIFFSASNICLTVI
uniref:Uncharacterized protein n=1 Tax=Lepeophtheirus salmonis TaxID=72036 RepID=A0A0K2V1A0_LEPSM